MQDVTQLLNEEPYANFYGIDVPDGNLVYEARVLHTLMVGAIVHRELELLELNQSKLSKEELEILIYNFLIYTKNIAHRIHHPLAYLQNSDSYEEALAKASSFESLVHSSYADAKQQSLLKATYWLRVCMLPYTTEQQWSYDDSDKGKKANNQILSALEMLEKHVINKTTYRNVNIIGHCLAMKYGFLLDTTAQCWEANNNQSVGVGLNDIVYTRNTKAYYYYHGEKIDREIFIEKIKNRHFETYKQYAGLGGALSEAFK